MTKIVLLSSLLLAFACASKNNIESNQKVVADPNVISFAEGKTTFKGNLFFPKNTGKPAPLVVVVPEWWGKTEYVKNRGQMLADQGYAALVVDVYGNDLVVEDPKDAQALATPFYQNAYLAVDRLSRYIDLAVENPKIDKEKIYAIGYCFGGTQVLNLARHNNPHVKGVVSFHGGLGAGIKFKDKIQSKILVLNGAADPMVPAKDIAAFKEEMKASKAKYTFVNYKGALHAFTNPKATLVGEKYKLPVKYDEKADKASWKELLKFLK